VNGASDPISVNTIPNRNRISAYSSFQWDYVASFLHNPTGKHIEWDSSLAHYAESIPHNRWFGWDGSRRWRDRKEAEMANDEHLHETCPNCGRNEITTDGRYGNKLKGRELLRQILRSPIWWVGFALLVLPAWFLGPDWVAWRCGLEALGFVLMVISGERIRRTVFAPSAATRFPEARYTCRLCGYQWTSEEPRTAVPHETGEPKETDRIESQEAGEHLHAVTETKSQTGQRSAAISFILAVFFNVLFVLLVKWATSADLALCLPVSMVVLALGGGVGALLAKSFGGNPWKGVTIGIWIGAVASLAILFVGIFAAGA
jgi:hypothetical protein